MAKEKIQRPDASEIQALLRAASQTDTQLKTIIDAEPIQRRSAQTSAQALYDARVKTALEEMDVEHINKGKQGIRVSTLRSAGISNIWQLSRMSFAQLCALDGIAEQGAWKIIDLTKQIVQHTKDTIRVRIRVENPSAQDDALIRALYIRIYAQPLQAQCSRCYQQHHLGLTQEAALAKQATNGLAWLFKSQQTKQQIVNAAQTLNARLTGPLNLEATFREYEQILSAVQAQCWDDYTDNAPRYYAELEKLGQTWVASEQYANGIPAQLAKQIEAQELDLQYLKATLRSYQTFGTKYIVHQGKCLLGDEMGLGKTIQAIAAMAALKAAGCTHFMVVCPASVLVNWCREIPKHSTLTATKVHGNDEAALRYWRENGDVAVTTYESISRFALPEKFRISMVVTDEAHYVKNPEAQRTKALMGLLKRTERALFMTGTPLENRVEEMCFLVDCLQPEVAQALDKVKYISTAEQFRQELAPVYLRRTRDDVLQELPDLIEKEQWCEQNTQEAQAYFDAVMSDNFMAMRQVSWHVGDMSNSSKAQRLLELCDKAMEENRKVIVFSFFRETLRRVSQLLGERSMEPITGSIAPQRRQEIIDEFAKAENGAVLVSQVQAGGTGLNIQSASVIIFCEPQIKPSIENQAISRAYRMGQVRDVLVYRLLSEDSIDEHIMQILRDKQNVFDNFAEESVVGTESLKEKEQAWISRMVAEEKARLLAQNPQPAAQQQSE